MIVLCVYNFMVRLINNAKVKTKETPINAKVIRRNRLFVYVKPKILIVNFHSVICKAI